MSPLTKKIAIVGIAYAFSAATMIEAADILWTGTTGGTADWNTGGNWSGGNFVNSSLDRADLRLDWATAPTVNLSAPVTLNGILFDDTGASGDVAITIGNGGIAANTLTFAGTDPTVSIIGSATISANILGSAGLLKSGAGTLILSGSNTLSGLVAISGGILQMGSTTALGAESIVRVDSGATLRVNSSATIAGLSDSAGSGGSVSQNSGGGKVLTLAGSGTYSFNGSISGTTSGAKVGLLISGGATQILGGSNSSIGYQSLTGSGGTLVFAKQNSIFQGLSTGAVVNANTSGGAGISVSANSAVVLGVGDSASGYFDSTAVATFLDSTHMGLSTNSTGFRNNSIFGFDTTNATGGTFTYSSALANIGTSTGIGFAKLGTGTLILDAANTYGGVTQVRAGTLQIGSSGTTGLIGSSGDITVSSSGTLVFNRSDNITVSNKLTGSGGFAQNGTGQLSLTSASSDFSGPISISAGILSVKSIGAGTVTLSGSAKQLKFDSSTTYSNPIVISAATGVSNLGVLDTSTGINAVLSGPITISAAPTNGGHFGSSSTGSITVTGSIISSVPILFRRGTGIFSNGGTGYSALQIRADTVKLGGNNGIATTASVAIGGDGSATLDLAGYNQTLVGITKGAQSATVTNSGVADSTLTTTGVSTFAGVIQDGATNKIALSVSGGRLSLSGSNTYTGSTTINSGTLQIADGSIANSSSITNNGTLDYNLNTNARTYGNVISGSGTLRKTGSNTLTLSGVHTYTGTTDVSAGRLYVSGSINGSTGISVSSGAELKVNGLINTSSTMDLSGTLSGSGNVGNVTVRNGGTLSPGNSPGTLTTGTLSLEAGGRYTFEMKTDGTGTPGTDWDQIVASTLSLSSLSSDNPFVLKLTTLDSSNAANPLAVFDPSVNHTWSSIISYSSLNGTFSSGLFAIDTTAFQNNLAGSFNIVQNGNALDLEYAAIPEPNSGITILFGAGILVLARRTRRLLV